MRNKLVPLVMMLAGGALILGAVGFIFFTGAQNSKPDLIEPPAGDNYPEVLRVSVADTRQALDKGTAIFLDVRSVESYEAGHLPGAISIPIDELPDRMQELDPNAWIITYCS